LSGALIGCQLVTAAIAAMRAEPPTDGDVRLPEEPAAITPFLESD
jgi:hypothetical protein